MKKILFILVFAFYTISIVLGAQYDVVTITDILGDVISKAKSYRAFEATFSNSILEDYEMYSFTVELPMNSVDVAFRLQDYGYRKTCASPYTSKYYTIEILTKSGDYLEVEGELVDRRYITFESWDVIDIRNVFEDAISSKDTVKIIGKNTEGDSYSFKALFRF